MKKFLKYILISSIVSIFNVALYGYKDFGEYVNFKSLSLLWEIILLVKKFIAEGDKAAKYIFLLFTSKSNSNDIGLQSFSVGVNNMIESNLVSTSLGVKATISNSIFVYIVSQ